MSHIAKIRGHVLDLSEEGKPRIKLTDERINDYVRGFIDSDTITLNLPDYPEYWTTEFGNLERRYVECEIRLLQVFAFGRYTWRASFINLYIINHSRPNDGI